MFDLMNQAEPRAPKPVGPETSGALYPFAKANPTAASKLAS